MVCAVGLQLSLSASQSPSKPPALITMGCMGCRTDYHSVSLNPAQMLVVLSHPNSSIFSALVWSPCAVQVTAYNTLEMESASRGDKLKASGGPLKAVMEEKNKLSARWIRAVFLLKPLRFKNTHHFLYCCQEVI